MNEQVMKTPRRRISPNTLWALRQTNSLKLVGTVVKVARYGIDGVVTMEVNGILIKISVRHQFKNPNTFKMLKGKRYFVDCHLARNHKDEEVIVHSNYFFDAPEELKDMQQLEITGTVRVKDGVHYIFCRSAYNLASEGGERPTYTDSRSYFKEIEIPYVATDGPEQKGDGIMFNNAALMTDDAGLGLAVMGQPSLIRRNGKMEDDNEQ